MQQNEQSPASQENERFTKDQELSKLKDENFELSMKFYNAEKRAVHLQSDLDRQKSRFKDLQERNDELMRSLDDQPYLTRTSLGQREERALLNDALREVENWKAKYNQVFEELKLSMREKKIIVNSLSLASKREEKLQLELKELHNIGSRSESEEKI